VAGLANGKETGNVVTLLRLLILDRKESPNRMRASAAQGISPSVLLGPGNQSPLGCRVGWFVSSESSPIQLVAVGPSIVVNVVTIFTFAVMGPSAAAIDESALSDIP
jgi:hypothetical protein